MRYFHVLMTFFIFSMLFCAPVNKDDNEKAKIIKVRFDKHRPLHEQYYIPVDTLKAGTKIKLSIDQKSFVENNIKTPMAFIFPLADSLFLNDDNYSSYTSCEFDNVTYLFVGLNTYDLLESKVLTIKTHTRLKPGETKRYPYTVYLKGVHELGDGDSSPAIIVEP